MRIDRFALTHEVKQLRTVFAAAQERHEICRARFFDRTETKDAREGGITRDDPAIRMHDEIAGKILLDETAVALFALSQRVIRLFVHGDIGVDLNAQRIRLIASERPAAPYKKFLTVTS